MRGGRLRKRDDVPDRLGPREHHHQPVESERHATVRRRAELKRLHQVSELLLSLLLPQPDGVKHLLLHVPSVDAERSAANLHAVVHEVVGDGPGLLDVPAVRHVLLVGRGERVVQRLEPVLVLVPLKHGEIGDPQNRVLALGDHVQGLGDKLTHPIHRLVHGALVARAEEEQVAGARAAPSDELLRHGLETLAERLAALERDAVLADAREREPARAARDRLVEDVPLGLQPAVAYPRPLRNRDGLDDAARLDGAGEEFKLGTRDDVRELSHLQAVPHVRLVAAVLAHGFRVGHPPERPGEIHVGALLERGAHEILAEVQNSVHVGERHLDVELGKLGLAIGPQVLVPEAPRHLIVPIRTRHHEHLLEQLRRLRQREARAGLEPRRDEVIASSLGGRPRQDRRLNLQEIVCILQHLTKRADGLGPEAQVADHLRSAKVQDAVLESNLLAQLVVVTLGGAAD